MSHFCVRVFSSSPLIIDDLVFTCTSNGAESSTNKVPAPDAPSFIAVDKKTGQVVWKDNSPGKNIMDGRWSSPCAGKVNGKMQVVFPGGDGWLRSFEPRTGKLLWKFNCNPRAAVFRPGGRGDKNYFIATPVLLDNKVYIGTSQNPEDGSGVGHFWCIDASKTPANKELDLSPVNDNFDPRAAVNKDSGLVWHFGGPVKNPRPGKGSRDFVFGRTTSTAAIHDGLLYAAELDGYLHCLDARTGEKYWDFDLEDGIWNSPYYVAGKVFLGCESGDLFVFRHGKQLKPPKKIDLGNPLKLPPCVAVNGVLYVNNGTHLYAIAAK
jgi:outer membrane protein assembly factor BamB